MTPEEQPIPKPPMKFSEFKTELLNLVVAREKAHAEFRRANDLYGQFIHDHLGVVIGEQATIESNVDFIEKILTMKEQEKCAQ
jgi:hypothetical protein